MILYFANRKMQIMGQASTNLPEGFVIMDDLKTEDVDSGIASFECTISYATEKRSEIEEMMQAGNYILRSHNGENEFYTIVDYEGDAKEQTVHVYAEDAGLDLLNEIAGEFENETAHNAEWYINKYIVDSGFEIGINEIPPDSVRTLSWTVKALLPKDWQALRTALAAMKCRIPLISKSLKLSVNLSISTQNGGKMIPHSFA